MDRLIDGYVASWVSVWVKLKGRQLRTLFDLIATHSILGSAWLTSTQKMYSIYMDHRQ